MFLFSLKIPLLEAYETFMICRAVLSVVPQNVDSLLVLEDDAVIMEDFFPV